VNYPKRLGRSAENPFARAARHRSVFSVADGCSGDGQAKLRSVLAEPLNRFEFTERGLTGRLTGNLGTVQDTGPEPYDLDFELYLKGDMLYGAVTTRPRPGARYGARLSYWVELRKRP